MGWARVSGQNVGVTGHAKSISKAFPTKPVAGNFIAVSISAFENLDSFTASDDAAPTPNTYHLAVTNGSNNRRNDLFYAYNILSTSSSTITVTATTSNASDYMSMSIMEWSGGLTTDPKNVTSSTTGSSSTPAPGAFTASANDLVIGCFAAGATGTCTPNTNYSTVDTEDLGFTNIAEGMEDQLNVSAGSYNPGWTFGNSVAWAACGASFKVASTGAALAATLAEIDSVTAALTTAISLASTLAEVDTMTAALTTAIPLASNLAEIDTMTADLTTAISFVAALAEIDTMTADLTTAISLKADLSEVDVMTADLHVGTPLEAHLAEINTVTADLSGGSAGVWHSFNDFPSGLERLQSGSRSISGRH